MRRSHSRKSFPADKMLPRRILWLTPYLEGDYAKYWSQRGHRNDGGSCWFEDRLGTRGERRDFKHMHTRKARQWGRRLERLLSEEFRDAGVV